MLGGVAAWPLAARAQHTPGKIYRIGMVEPISAELNAGNLAAFRQGLQDLGYVEGRNFVLEYRSADGDARRFPALISELIGLNIDLLVTRGTPAALAAKNATSTHPRGHRRRRRAAFDCREPRPSRSKHHGLERLAAGSGAKTGSNI